MPTVLSSHRAATVRPAAGRLVWVVVAVALLAPSSALASHSIVFSSADFSTLGLRPVSASVGQARAQLLARLPSRAGRLLDAALSQASAATTRGQQLHSDAFVLRSAFAAERVLASWQAVHRGERAAIGAGGAVSVTGSRKRAAVQVLWRDGARLGLIVLIATRDTGTARSTAISYAQLAESYLNTPLPTTAWDKVLDQIRPDGTVSKQTALQAFALSYGPLPGVVVPSGRSTVAESGDLAGDWVLQYLPGLPRRLQLVIYRDLGLTPPAATAHAASYGDPEFTPDATLTAEANGWATFYSNPNYLGHALGLQIVAGNTTAVVPGVAADSYPVNAAGAYSPTGPYCRIRVVQVTPATLQHVLAHEVFHCEEFDLYHDAVHLPAWVLEGLAEWAAQTVEPSTIYAHQNLEPYFGSSSTPLFTRSYDAEGFWGHVQDTVGGLWKKIGDVLTASGNEFKYAVAGGITVPFLSTWGSSVFNLTTGGLPWETVSPSVTTYSPPVVKIAPSLPGRQEVEAVPYTTAQYVVVSEASTPLLHASITGSARLSTTYNYTDLSDAWFCTSESCQCPPGDQSSIPFHDPLTSRATLGLTGDPSGGTKGTLTAYPLSAFCKPVAPPPPPPGTGTAGSGGDPHLIDFDGAVFDLQQAGEFTLLKSTQDDLEIQVRQQPEAGCSGPTSVAFNTAAAMRVGSATVEVDLHGQSGLLTYLNKARVHAAEVSLGHGHLSVVGSGGHQVVEVVWPDGSSVNAGRGFGGTLDISVHLARGRRGHVQGLLGNWGVPASSEFVGRDGRGYAQGTITGGTAHDFNVRYHQFAASWRITQRESLFRYPHGKSTSSYTIRDFPEKPLTVATLPAPRLAAGQKACTAAGITNAEMYDACVLDVGATCDPGFAAGDEQLGQATGLPVTVPGTADIFGAGQAQPPALDGNPGPGTGGGTVPPDVSFASAAGEVLTVPSVTGAVYCDSSMVRTATPNGPCGGDSSATDLNPVGAISGIVDTNSNDFLTGVFLSGAPPTGSPPASLNFSSSAIGADYTTLSPQLGQTFLIGNGRTSSGTLHQIIVPAGATRLSLGIADGYDFEGDPGYYDDDGGAYQASVDFGTSG